VKEGKALTVTDPKMTRFMMSIDDAVDLVLYAYEHGQQGDVFVQKAPAATIETLALAVKKVFNASNPIRVIGTRHGEKAYETLLTREEYARAKDLGRYFRVPADNRDLNYNAYFTQGQESVSRQEDYHSNNTRRLDTTGMAELLLKLDLVREELAGWDTAITVAQA
jgi:UDP-glucose 4-epimerase